MDFQVSGFGSLDFGFRFAGGGHLAWRTSKAEAGNKLDGRTHRDHPFGKKIPSNQIVVPLTSEERNRLGECEAKIRKGLDAFVEVGIALMEIRDSRLYREKFGTFEDYVQTVLSLVRSHAYHLMGSAQVICDLSTIVDRSELPVNEAQARILVPLKTPEERIEAWQKVRASAGDRPITAKVVSEIIFPEKYGRKDRHQDTKVQIRSAIAKLRKLFANTDAAEDAERLLKQLENLRFLKPTGASHAR